MTTQTLDEIISGQGEALSDAASPELHPASNSTSDTPEQSDFGKQLADANAAWERRFSEVLDAVRTPHTTETSDTIVREHRDGTRDRRKLLWTLLMFQLWYDRWMDH